MRIKQSSIEDVKNAIDVVDVIDAFVELKKRGRDWKACCPFHDEKTPSFSVSENLGIYKCFGCGAAGDGVKFIMEHEKLNYVEAIEYLARKYNITLEYENRGNQENNDDSSESVLIALDFAKKFFQDCLTKTPHVLQYLHKRKISSQIIQFFELGYNPPNNEFKKEALKKGFNENILLAAGLLNESEGRGSYDKFYSRLTFPIKSHFGKVVGFGARTLKNTSQAKYINSPESVVYKKSHLLYGLYEAKKAISQQEVCYLMEGYMDVLAMQQAGVPTAVAASGTALTEEQIKLLKRLFKGASQERNLEVVLMFDSDSAGLKATYKSIESLLAQNLNVKVVTLPKGEDPDSYTKKLSSEKFKVFLKSQAKDFLDFQIEKLLTATKDDPIRRSSAITYISRVVHQIPDEIKRDTYLDLCSQKLSISKDILVAEGEKMIRQKTIQKNRSLERKRKQQKVSHSLSAQELQEIETIRLLLNYGDVKVNDTDYICDYLIEELKGVVFMNPMCQKIIAIYYEKRKENQFCKLSDILKNEDINTQQTLIELAYQEYELSPNWKDKNIKIAEKDADLPSALHKNILYLKLRVLQNMRKNIKNQMDNNDFEEQLRHMRRIEKINEDICQISQSLTMVIG